MAGARVTVYERMPSAGRKLLLAGRGGLNLSHSEERQAFRARYGQASAALTPALDAFGPEALRDWCAGLGIETFVGSSGRVFPVGLKTSPLLRAWLRRLGAAGVTFLARHRWLGWDEEGHLRFAAPEGEAIVRADATILALGGATWPHLGSDGTWAPVLAETGAEIAPLRPANCGFVLPWSDTFRDRFEGHPLKNVAVRGGEQRGRGDLVITREGLEGGPIYAVSAALRDAIARDGSATFHVALRPDLDRTALIGRLARRKTKDSFGNAMRKALGLAPAAVALLRDIERPGEPPLPSLGPDALAALIEAVPLRTQATMPLAGAISTAGGLRFGALDPALMLRGRPGTFVAGEMLDWDAPTGGYLLTACFATGRAAGQAAAAWAAGGGD